MHDRLYEHCDALTDDELVEHAAALGLDTDRFAAALDGHEHGDRIHEDFEGGLESGVRGTPTFFIDGERYDERYTVDARSSALAFPAPGHRPTAAVDRGDRLRGAPEPVQKKTLMSRRGTSQCIGL